jgi:catechol 2,3-dioxygenase-like lactoylglutathione lyase family enzyme
VFYYGAFLLDPDGNSAEAVTFSEPREGDNVIDHLWIRVADVDASRRFYETIGRFAGIQLSTERPERVHFAGANRSFALVQGEPTQNVHLAFPAADHATVEEFHRAATAAGYRDNGPPGERPVYHRGYYGAYVLDPDGNNVEVVNNNR